MNDRVISARFREADQPALFAEFQYLVQCPRCQAQAVVAREAGTVHYRSSGGHIMPNPHVRVLCTACGYARSVRLDGMSEWAGPSWVRATGRCSRCGRWVERDFGRRLKPPRGRLGRVRCSGCGHTSLLPYLYWSSGVNEARDPYFGLALWLQIPCAGKVLWAWNEAHLTFLENYVGATLRERVPNQNNSLASRLPTWIKDRKHREEVLDGLARLRQSLMGSD